MLLVILDSEKLFTAFVGAFIAIILKLIFDWVNEESRLQDIRDIIYIDLCVQRDFYIELYNICKKLTKYVKQEIDIFPLPKTNFINNNIFKAYTPRDLFKTFDKVYYTDLLFIYQLINSHSTQLVIDDYDSFIEEIITKSKETSAATEDKYAQHFEDSATRCNKMVESINKLIEKHTKLYAISNPNS